MYKILYISQFPQIGGGETALLYLISKIDKKKFELHIIIPQKGQFYDRLKKLDVKIHILNLPPYLIRTFFIPGASPISITKLLILIRKINPDIIHVNHLTLSIYAGISAKVFKLQTLGTAHGIWDSLYFYQNLIYRIFIKKIIANSPKTANNLLNHHFLKSQDIKTIFFGIDTNFFRPPTIKEKIKAKNRFKIPSKNTVISCVGRLDPQKNQLAFLESAKLIVKKTSRITFLIVGSEKGDFSNAKANNNYYQKLKDFLKAYPDLKMHTQFIPYQENIKSTYWATDILVSSSYPEEESFGLAMLEASSCAIPVLSTNTYNRHLIVQNGKTGYLFNPENPKNLAEKILLLHTNDTLRKKLGDNARKFILPKFSIQRYVQEIQEVYQEVYKELLKSKD